MVEEREEQLTLPEEIVKDLLAQTEVCANFVKELLLNANYLKDEARSKLQQEGRLCQVRDVEPCVEPDRVEGVDGSLDIIHGAAVDFAVCAAVGVGKDIRHIIEVLPTSHSQFLSRTCQGVMTMLELRLMAESQAPLIIYDGSFISALVRVNAALAAREEHPDDGLWQHVDPLFKRLSEIPAWFLSVLNSNVVACPKLSTSDSFIRQHFPSLKGVFSDRSFFTFVLEPGEFVVHKPSFPATNLGRTSRFIQNHPDRRKVELFFDRVGFWEVFYRPHVWSPAYKLEMPGRLSFGLKDEIAPILQTFRSLLPDPSLLEPYPQFLADALCRQISAGIDALRDGVESLLCAEGLDAREVHSTLTGYRTRMPRHE